MSLRTVITAFALLWLASAALAAPANGPALGQALVAGDVDPLSFDFGQLRYAPGQTIGFLGAQSAAQTAAAKSHAKPTWQSVLDAHICPTLAERMTMAGFESALIAPSAAVWIEEKSAADRAYARYIASRDAVLAGQPSPYPEFKADEATVAAAGRTTDDNLKSLYRHSAEDQLWRHAITFGGSKSYASGVGAAGRVWLNARIVDEGCLIDQSNTSWLKTQLKTLWWYDAKTYDKGADEAAWLIAQHADADPELQTLVLERIGPLVLQNRSDPGDYAYLWDRVALNTGRAQRYGTQMQCVGGVWSPKRPLEEPDKLDERRGWVRLVSEATYARTGREICRQVLADKP